MKINIDIEINFLQWLPFHSKNQFFNRLVLFFFRGSEKKYKCISIFLQYSFPNILDLKYKSILELVTAIPLPFSRVLIL